VWGHVPDVTDHGKAPKVTKGGVGPLLEPGENIVWGHVPDVTPGEKD